MNRLILGDNLEILQSLETESVDLIYIDPPFFSNRNYEVIWGDAGEVRSFEDRWSGGMMQYIDWLKVRVEQMYRLLKPTGSFFLHCDWHADAYIRVHIMDRIFGESNFRSHIIWRRNSAHNDIAQGRKEFGNITDSIFYYSKSNIFTFNPIYTQYDESYVNAFYKYYDENGRRYRLDNLTGPGGASKGNPFYEVMGISRYWRYSKEKMDRLIEEGRIIQTKPGNVPSYKRYLDEMPGVALQNEWSDIKIIQSQAKERIGYPTQKPEALMKRIIEASSNEGDVVLDAFVGGGTTIAVADKLNRQWIGIDQSVQAIKVTEMRLNNQQDLFSQPFITTLHKYDYDTLRYKDAFAFESFIVTQFGGTANSKQRGDLGLDGKTRDGAPIQVKRSDNIGRNVIDNFKSACERFDKRLYEKNKEAGEAIGHIIAFSFGKGAIEEAARLRSNEEVIIKLVKVEDIIPIAKKPVIKLDFKDMGADAKKLREIEFTAHGTSDAGIEFYAWDWDYDNSKQTFKPEVLLDKTGTQKHKFKPGQHTVAVKVVDNDGLEAVEIVKLKINGEVKISE